MSFNGLPMSSLKDKELKEKEVQTKTRELTGRIWKEREIGRHYWNKQIGKLEGGTHTARKRAHETSPVFVPSHVGVYTTDTHIRQAAITHHHPTKEGDRERGREREEEERRLAVISTMQTATQFSLSGHIETHRSEMHIWIALVFELSTLPKHKQVESKFHKRCYFLHFMSPVSLRDIIRLCCCNVSLMEWD